MTNNPLSGGRGAGKATVADLEVSVDEMNVTAAEYNCPWRFAVVPNDTGKMCVRRTEHRPSPRLEAKRDVMDRRGESMTHADTDELNKRLEHLGATARYRPDGSKYFIEVSTPPTGGA